MAFKKVSPKVDFVRLEHKIINFWQQRNILKKYLKKNEKSKKLFRFLDGPITANNPMGVHHAWGRTYKDLWQRFQTMQGKRQRYQNGFDCQGLWVEVEVEKELGFKTKKDIENYGIAKFVNKCKERVLKYSAIQTEQSKRLGYFMDWNDSYYTMSDENNYMIWNFLKKCHEKGYLYKGHDVVPWCIRCGTAISQHEILTEEYKELTHKSIYIKLKIKGKKNEYFLVWTTTPWTLSSNTALAVNPDLDYVKVKVGKDYYYLSKGTLDVIELEYETINQMKGKEFLGWEYEGPFNELEAQKGVIHKVILWKDVGEEEGTGIVHIAPGCGEEDFKLGKEFDLAVISPLDDAGNYIAGFGFLTGRNVKNVNEAIFENLESKKIVYRIHNYTHRYPTCWRCKKELVFRLVDEWYIAMDKIDPDDKKERTLRKQMMDVAKKISWIPSFGLERELDWLRNMHDWLISKKRYWGLALPIFECECGNFEVIGSKEELKKKAAQCWDKFEGNSPHRPWVDEVQIKCSKCSKKISRVPDVGNPWLDAGIVPFSTIVDPRTKKLSYTSDKKYWRQWYPADFITESFPGQFKNWFYALIAMSTVMEDKEPYKTVLGFATVHDEKGEEMHKSKDNMIVFDDAAEEIGVDVMRWVYIRQNPVLNLNFGYHLASEIRRKILTLWNVYSFFATYASIDKWDPQKNKKIEFKNLSLLDKWILSKLYQLIDFSTKELEEFRAYNLMNQIEKFIDDLSVWYVRRSRRRFWKSKNDQDKNAAYQTLYEVLANLSCLLAPVIPHISEAIYQNLGRSEESIHLTSWPKSRKNYIDNKLEKEMFVVRQVVELAHAARAESGIKVRQPLARCNVKTEMITRKELQDLIQDEINVKNLIIKKGKKLEVNLETKITPSLQKEGLARELIRQIQQMRKEADFNVEDRIETYCQATDKKLNQAIEFFADHKDYSIKKETLSTKLVSEKPSKLNYQKDLLINNKKIWVGLIRQ
jgi:isoleucyl-tRNA synthetase